MNYHHYRRFNCVIVTSYVVPYIALCSVPVPAKFIHRSIRISYTMYYVAELPTSQCAISHAAHKQ
uniref:Uncharacterized protein n=1 Tax=Ciona intestinalis TaxID=7719 RepID=F6VMX2_CIOIN